MKVALIDSDFMIYVAAHNKKDEPEKTLEECKLHADQLVYNIVSETGATHYIMTLTVGRNFRYTINPEYKANRKSLEKPKYFSEVKQHLIETWKAIYNEQVESDDLVITMKNYFDSVGVESFITSNDKDVLRTEGTHYNPRKNEWITTTKEEAHEALWCSLITGDATDNIKGIPKKGEVFFKKLKSSCISQNIPLYLGVMQSYIDHYGENQGIEQFYKNYKSLYILKEFDNFIVPTPIEYKIEKDEFTKFLEEN